MNQTNKKLILIFTSVILFLVLIFVFQKLNLNQKLLNFNEKPNNLFFILTIIVAALIDSINPCAFSILLLTIAFLFSLNQQKKQILKIGFLYILGIYLTYFLIGLGILKTLNFLNIPHFMAKIGAFLIIIFGLINILNEIFPQFPLKFKIPQKAHPFIAKLIQKTSLPAAFILGFAVALFEFPCTGGAYLMILGLLHDYQSYFQGLIYLIFYNLIFISPLLVILFAIGNKTVLERIENWRGNPKIRFKLISSLLLTLLGILIVTLVW